MTKIPLLLLLSALPAPGQLSFPRVGPDRTFYAASYGAIPGDAIDDRAAIQAACTAAAAAGGGKVKLVQGAYKVVVVYDSTTTFDSGTKTKTNGHYGIEVPNGVEIEGEGKGVTYIDAYVGTANGDTGHLINPLGSRSAATAYAAGGFTLRNLTLRANDVDAPETGILLADVHANGIKCYDVEFGSCRFHAGETDYSKNLLLERCTFTGSYSYGPSGSFWQWDAGDNGTGSTWIAATDAPITGQRWRFITAGPRSSADTSPRDFDMCHGAIRMSDCRFEDFTFYGRNNATATFIVGVDATQTDTTCDDIMFLRGKFVLYTENDVAISASHATYASAANHANRWTIQGCDFSGPAQYFVLAGNGSSSSLTQYDRHQGWKLIDNVATLDLTGISAGSHYPFSLNALDTVEFRGNTVRSSGTQAGASTIYLLNAPNTSGVVAFNTFDHAGSATVMYNLVNDCTVAEAGTAAATHPGYRLGIFGNRFKGNVNTHVYCPADAAANTGLNFRVDISDNHIEGTGTAYNLTNLWRANVDAGRTGVAINPASIGATTAGSGAFTTITGTTLDTTSNIDIASTATDGLRVFNTADQTTNMEWVQNYWTGNNYWMALRSAGSGNTSRSIYFGSVGTHTGTVGIAHGGTARINVTAASSTFTATTDSTTKDTGSIITEGGIGAEKNIVAGLKLSSTATTPATLAAAATTLAITSNVATVTGDAGGNTLATITGGLSGMTLTLIFTDANVTLTDTAAATADTMNLSAAFTSTANDTITFVHNGTKWFETARSVN